MSTRPRAAKSTIAVTGAAGQLGTLILRRLIDDRSVGRIIAIDRTPLSLVSGKLSYVPADVRDPELHRSFEGASAVIHLAFIVTSKLPRAEFDDINVNGSRNVFDAVIRARVPQLLYASSIAAYGVLPGHPELLVEDSPRRLAEDMPYSAAKYRVEEELDRVEREHPELIAARIRPTILIGSRLNNPLAELFARGIASGMLFGAGDAELPVVWDEDVADLFMLALRSKARGAYNAGSDEPLALSTLARETGLRLVSLPPLGLRAIAGFSRLTGLGAVDPSWQKGAGIRMWSSSEKAKRELGWKPKYPTALSVMKRHLEVAPGRHDPRIAAFMRLAAFGAEHAPPEPETTGMSSVIHLEITGRGGADYTIRVHDRRVRITRGVPRPPTSVASMDTETFRELLSNRVSYATASMTGRLRLEGDTSAGFVIPSLFARFRAEAQQSSLRGRAIRTVARFLQGAQP